MFSFLLDCIVSICLTLNLQNCSPKQLQHFYSQQQRMGIIVTSYFCQLLAVLTFLILPIQLVVFFFKWVVLNYVFSLPNDLEHLFMYLSARSSFLKYLFKFFPIYWGFSYCFFFVYLFFQEKHLLCLCFDLFCRFFFFFDRI